MCLFTELFVKLFLKTSNVNEDATMNNRAVDSDAKFDTTKIEDRSLINRITESS